MASDNQVGNIVYQVEMEVGKLITSQQQVNSRLDQMEDKFNSNAKSASNLESGMTKLASAIKLVMAAAALRGLADMVQRYQEMSERVQMATTSQSEFEHVQQRLLKTANGTYRSLSEAQELYITTAASLRSMNYTTDQAIDVQDSMSYAFVKNATSADRANGAISAFSKSMNKGKVEADSWETIIAAIPSVIDDIATASGKTSAQIRLLGSSGKITANQLSEGLRQSLDANSEAAAGMSNNLTDAGVRMKTAITSILVAMEGQTGALQAFTNGIISAADAILGFSQDTEKMPKALGALSVAAGIVAAVMASRYVGAMYVATAENIKHAASAYRVAAAQGAMATSARAGSLALSLVGGPAGAAMLAATAIFYFYQKSQQARQEAIAFADGVDKLNNSMKSMSNTALKGTISDANVAIRGQVEAVADLESEIKNLIASRDDYVNRGKQFGTTAEQGNGLLQKAAEITDTLNQKQRDLSGLQSKLVATIKVRDDAQITLNNNMLTSMGVHDNLIEKGSALERVQGAVAKAFGNTADEINRANQAGNNFNPQSLQVSAPTADGDKYIQSLEDQNKLLAIKDERLRAVTQAEMDQSKVTDNPNQIKRAGELAGTLYDQKKAQEGIKKETAAATKGETAAEAAEKRRVKSLQDLSNEMAVAELKTKGLNREAAQLAAVQDLGSGASQQQIQQATQQAGQIFDIQQRMADKKAAIDADSVAKAEQQRKLDLSQLDRQLAAGDISFEQSQQRRVQIAADYSKSIAEASATKAVTPQQELAAQVDPVQALANENARKLALIQQFTQQKVITEQQGLALMNAANNQYEQQRTAAQWELLSQQSVGYDMLTSAVDSFAGNASNAITGLLTGTMSVSDAMRSLGNTILNQVINGIVQMGVEWVKNLIIQKAMGAAVSAASAAEAVGVAAAWAPAAAMASLATLGANAAPASAGITSTVGLATGLAVSGMRKNGGPVSAGSMYQVGEGGLPEIYQASNGKQYMIPGDNGSVVSNKDMNGGNGQINVTMNFENYSSGATVDAQAQSDGKGGVTIQAIVYDISQGGPIGQAISTFHNAPRRATN
ncbi:tape measure protein [Yersinia hibernica]|uniref:tape measure protein n=1 Tax=Yersinia hibernica TaxID=2339259 RepID=UPI0011A67FFC|nr:tape measure protein [Yersinia hibernica]